MKGFFAAPIHYRRAVALWALLLAAGCSWLPESGPSAHRVSAVTQDANAATIELVDVSTAIAQKLAADQQPGLFSDVFKSSARFSRAVGAGDEVAITIWEAPPATLFTGGLAPAAAPAGGGGGGEATVLPDQEVGTDGTIQVPFAGRLDVSGLSPRQVEDLISGRLQGKAHQPQVLARITHNSTADVTIVGDVATSMRMPLTPKSERLLDALAAAGGTKEPTDKVSLQLARGKLVAALPLDTIIRDPAQNIPLQAGDVVTALFQPYSFTVLGATGANREVNFEAQGITLSQALARAGGLDDNRANVKGVFIFRFEPDCALAWPSPHFTTADGKVAVIYRVDLADPASFFVAQNFPMRNKDIMFVANSPSTDLKKFFELLQPVTVPVVNGAAVKSGV